MIHTAIELVANSSLAQANALVRNGEFLNAKEAYEQCIGTESDNSAAWYGLGVANHHLGDEEAAIVAFERAFLLNRYHAPTAANLAVLYQARDDESAVRYAKSAVDLGLENEHLQAIINHSVKMNDEVLSNVDDEEVVEPQPEELVLISGAVRLVDSEEGEVSLIDQASQLLNEGGFEAALNLISPALEGESADDAELWYLCGKALASLDLIDDAKTSLSFCLELNSDHEGAIQLLSLISKEGNDGGILEDEGHTDATSPMFEEEESKLANVELVEYSEHRDGEIFDERSSESQNEPIDSDESPFIALEDSLVVLIRQGTEASETGDHATAVQTWKKIIEDYGSTSKAWHGMAQALEVAGHVEKAQQCREKAQELHASELESTDTGTESVDLVAAAVEATEQVTERIITPDDDVNVAIEWYNKGLTLLSEEKGLEALNCFEKAISSTPREERELRVRSHNGRGHSLHQLGRFAESIQSYHQAISMDPSIVSGRTLYNMGSSYAAMEHFQDAIRCFEQALERDLDEEESRLCKTQLNRCSLLLKEQMKAERLQA